MVECDPAKDRVTANYLKTTSRATWQLKNGISLKKWLYYISVFLIAFFPEDIEKLTIVKIGGIQLYGIDFIYLLVLVALSSAIVHRKAIQLPVEGKVYVAMLAWIAVAVVNGFFQYGHRAFGESRYVLPFFAFFVPFALIDDSGNTQVKQVVEIVSKTIIIAAAAGFILFCIELINGGRFFVTAVNRAELSGFEDFRGVRYLGSTHTFNILALASMLIIRFSTHKRIKLLEILSVIALFIAALVSRNRAALFATLAGLVVLLISRGRIKLLLVSLVSIVAGFYTVQLVEPSMTENISTAILSGLNPAEDPTGQWRLVRNLSAFDQAMITPWFGQGLGGYLDFEDPSHNQFLFLFLKTGLPGTILCIVTIVLFLRRYLIVRKDLARDRNQDLIGSVLALIIVSQLAYGMAYGFIPFYGVYYGFGLLLFRSVNARARRFRLQAKHSENGPRANGTEQIS